jgi:hypothetical protein
MNRPRPLLYVIFAIAAIVMFIVFLPFQVCRDWAFVCENTGSRKGYRVWFCGFETGHWYEKSNLEEFMETKYSDNLTHRWTSYAGTGKNVFGSAVLHGHGQPGPIVTIPYDVLNQYVSHIEDEKKKALYDLFTSNNKQRIAKEISMIWDQALNLPDEKNEPLDSNDLE